MGEAQLWPTQNQMKDFIDKWATAFAELDAAYQTLQREHTVRVLNLEQQINTLRIEASNAEAPLRQRIALQDAKIQTLTDTTERQQGIIDDAVRQLGRLLETNTALAGVTLQTLLSDAIILVEETKRQFQNSL